VTRGTNFIDVKEIGDYVVLYFRIEDTTMSTTGRYFSRAEITLVSELVEKETGYKLPITTGDYYYNRPPYLNLDLFIDNGADNHIWQITNEENRKAFVRAISRAIDLLRDLPLYKIIDPVEDAISQISTQPATCEIGSKRYQVVFTPITNRYDANAALNTATRTRLEQIDAAYVAAVREIKRQVESRTRAQNIYNVSFEDYKAGFTSFVFQSYNSLAMAFTFNPLYALSGNTVYRIKDDHRKPRRGILIYHPQSGVFFVNPKTFQPIMTPHTNRRDSGHMCTGNISTSSNLDYAKAKEVLIKVAQSLDTININSLAHSYFGNIPINSDFLEKMCVPESQAAAESQTRGEISTSGVI